MGGNSTPVLHHALVWITKIIQDQYQQHTGFVQAKIVYTSAKFTKHSDVTDELWNQLKVKVMPRVQSFAVYLSTRVLHIAPLTEGLMISGITTASILDVV